MAYELKQVTAKMADKFSSPLYFISSTLCDKEYRNAHVSKAGFFGSVLPETTLEYPTFKFTYEPGIIETKKLPNKIINFLAKNRIQKVFINQPVPFENSFAEYQVLLDYVVRHKNTKEVNGKEKTEETLEGKIKMSLPTDRRVSRLNGFEVHTYSKSREKKETAKRMAIGNHALMNYGFQKFFHSPDGSCITYVCFKPQELSGKQLEDVVKTGLGKGTLVMEGAVITHAHKNPLKCYTIQFKHDDFGKLRVEAKFFGQYTDAIADLSSAVIAEMFGVDLCDAKVTYFKKVKKPEVEKRGYSQTVKKGLKLVGWALISPFYAVYKGVEYIHDKVEEKRREREALYCSELKQIGLQPYTGDACWISMTPGCKQKIIEKGKGEKEKEVAAKSSPASNANTKPDLS